MPTANASDVGEVIQHHLDEAHKVASREVERLARKILKQNRELSGFCMAMGSATFYDQDRQPLWAGDPRVRELDTFIDAWDRSLRLTGEPMKINTWDGPIIRNW